MKISLVSAFKNLSRAKVRSIITIITATLGVAGYIFFSSLNDGTEKDVLDNFQEYEVGHSQILTKEHFKEHKMSSFDYLFNYESLKPQLEKLKQQGIKVEPRIETQGELIFYKSDGYLVDGSLRMNLVQVNPKMSEIKGLEKGKTLAQSIKDEDNGIWMSEYLAKKLGAKLGSSIMLSTKTADGAYEAVDATIVGIYATPSIMVNMREVFVTPSIMKDYLDADVDIEATNILFDKEKVDIDLSKNSELSWHPWQDVGEDILFMQKFDSSRMLIFTIFMTVIVSIGIINTMIMSVYERIKEIGTMRAFGIFNKELITLYVYEGFAIGIIASVLGIILGCIIIIPLIYIGINVSGLNNEGASMLPAVLRGTWPFIAIIRVSIYSTVLSGFFAGLAAYSSSRKTVVECLNS